MCQNFTRFISVSNLLCPYLTLSSQEVIITLGKLIQLSEDHPRLAKIFALIVILQENNGRTKQQ